MNAGRLTHIIEIIPGTVRCLLPLESSASDGLQVSDDSLILRFSIAGKWGSWNACPVLFKNELTVFFIYIYFFF